jgi:hypothetical protein
LPPRKDHSCRWALSRRPSPGSLTLATLSRNAGEDLLRRA